MYGREELLKRDITSMDFKTAEYTLDISKTQSPQRAQSEFELPKGAKLLKEVIVRSTKIEDPTKHRPYGKPDYVLKAKDINTSYGNLLYALQGKFPGLVVRQVSNPGADGGPKWMVYLLKAAGGTINFSPEVPLTGKDTIVWGSPADNNWPHNPSIFGSLQLESGAHDF